MVTLTRYTCSIDCTACSPRGRLNILRHTRSSSMRKAPHEAAWAADMALSFFGVQRALHEAAVPFLRLSRFSCGACQLRSRVVLCIRNTHSRPIHVTVDNVEKLNRLVSTVILIWLSHLLLRIRILSSPAFHLFISTYGSSQLHIIFMESPSLHQR